MRSGGLQGQEVAWRHDEEAFRRWGGRGGGRAVQLLGPLTCGADARKRCTTVVPVRAGSPGHKQPFRSCRTRGRWWGRVHRPPQPWTYRTVRPSCIAESGRLTRTSNGVYSTILHNPALAPDPFNTTQVVPRLHSSCTSFWHVGQCISHVPQCINILLLGGAAAPRVCPSWTPTCGSWRPPAG